MVTQEHKGRDESIKVIIRKYLRLLSLITVELAVNSEGSCLMLPSHFLFDPPNFFLEEHFFWL